MPWIFSYADLNPQILQDVLGKAPFCTLPASLVNNKVSFKGKSRKWRGAVATLDKAKKKIVYGSALLLPPEELRLLDRYYRMYQRKISTIYINATGDKVKAYIYVLPSDAKEGLPSSDYIKAVVKHLKFFWGTGDKKNLSLEDFGINTPFNDKPKAKEPKESKKEKKTKKTSK